MSSSDQRRYPWMLFLIAAPAAVAIWSGWVGLGGMCGFGPIRPFPGIWDSLVINTAITLPVGVESYGAYAMHAWLARADLSARTREFARTSAFAALGLGCVGQVAFHLLTAAHWPSAPWPVTMGVACLPVVTLSLAAMLAHMVRADTIPAPAAAPVPVLAMAPAEALPDPVDVPPDVPAEVPPEVPQDVPSRSPSEDRDARAARAAYRRSVTAGRPLSQAALGALYGRSKTWGRNRIDEVKAAPVAAAQ